jgi:hypothetical protein
MAEARKKARETPSALTPAKKKRKHLEGLAYYLVYVPALIVFVLLALLFVDAVDEYMYGDDD